MPTIVLGVLVVSASVAYALGGLFASQRWLGARGTGDDNDVTGIIVSLVGVMYPVLLAFVVVIVWGQFNDAERATQVEATRISNLLRDAEVFPDEPRTQIRGRLLAYTGRVVDAEWSTLADGESHRRASDSYEAVWRAYYRFAPRTEQQRAFYDQSLGRLNELGESRRLRILSSRAKVPGVMWVLLIVGGLVTIASTWAFRMKDPRLHAIGVSLFAILTGFILFLVFALEHPFTGDVRVQPDAFQDLADQWSRRSL